MIDTYFCSYRSEQLEERLKNRILENRERRIHVSRRRVQLWAIEMTTEDEGDFKASNGWLDKFLKRNGFSLRKRTTVCQRTPDEYIPKLVSFVYHLGEVRNNGKFPDEYVYVMDELSLWLEPLSETTINVKGDKNVPILSSGSEKMRITVALTAKANEKKLKPFVIIPRKRPVKELEENRDILFAYSSKSWMDDSLTEKYLKSVIGAFSFGRHLIIWDTFSCHKSERTKKVLKEMRMDSVIVPSGCTGLIQAPDVSWNRSFKANLQKRYDDFAHLNGNENGKLPKPSFSTVSQWIIES